MKRRFLGIAVLGLIGALLVGACSSSSSAAVAVDDIYAIGLQGQATSDGVIVLNEPDRIEVDLITGVSSLDVALALRSALRERGHEVICVTHRGGDIFSLVVRGEVQISSERSDLGGIGGSAAQVIQRPEVIQSTVREYLRYLRESSPEGLAKVVTEDYLPIASADLGKSIELVSTEVPAIGCHSASIVVQVEMPNGVHEQNEVHLRTTGDLYWRISGVTPLASWTLS